MAASQGVSLTELLQPQVVMDVFSRLKDGHGPLGSYLGFQPNSYNVEDVSMSGPNTFRGQGAVRNYTYRLFDNTRVPMKFRAPGTGPATVAANPMGVNTVSIARMHQKIPLNYEFLGNLSPMIGPNSSIDEGGQDYIGRQWRFLKQQAGNAVEMMAAGMMRDSLYLQYSGDNWLPTFTAPNNTTTFGFQINFQIPSTNKGQLANQMGTNASGGNIILISWDNVGAPILSNLQSIIAAFRLLNRYPLTDNWVNSLMWSNIILNTQVRNTAGSSNVPFAEYERHPESGMGDSGPEGEYSFVLRGEPTVRWHICNDALALGTDIDPVYTSAPSTATLAKMIPDTMCIFGTKPSPDWTRFYLGGEHVVENPGMPGVLRMGWYFWPEYVTQPGAIELLTVLNAVPILPVPTAIAPATVVGF